MTVRGQSLERWYYGYESNGISSEICRRERFLKGVGHFDHPLNVEGDVAHQPLLGSRKLEGLPFHTV